MFLKKLKEANIYFLVILLLGIFSAYPLSYIFSILNITDYRMKLFITHLTIFIMPAIIYLLLSPRSIKDTLRINKLYFKDALLLILLAFVCQPMVTLLSLISQLVFPNNVAMVITSIIDTPYLLFLLLFAVMPAITEEITIRGVVLAGYDDENIFVSAVVTGLFFGIMHLDGQQFLYAVALGIILALVVRITKSIFSSMIIHFIINGTSVTLSKLMELLPASEEELQAVSEVTLKNVPNSVVLGAIFFYAILTIICFVAIYFIFKKLISLNVKRNILTREEVRVKNSLMKSIKDVVNLPLVLIIGIYIIYMSFFS